MSPANIELDDPRITEALDELKTMIKRRYTDAEFQVFRGEDPEGIYLRAIVDIDDLDEVLDLVIDRLVQVQVDEGLPVYFLPVWPLERIGKELADRKKTATVFAQPQSP